MASTEAWGDGLSASVAPRRLLTRRVHSPSTEHHARGTTHRNGPSDGANPSITWKA
jgi:hypothetical protein